jgi:hypothetical protein
MFNIQIESEGVTFTFSEAGEGHCTTAFTVYGTYRRNVNMKTQRALFESHDGNDEIFFDWSHPNAILIGSDLEIGDMTFSVAKTPEILESFLKCLEQWRLSQKD